jgi:hypothetical protein
MTHKIILSVFLIIALVVPCWAAETAAPEAGQAVENVSLAARLAEIGRAEKAPLILASAAQILGEVTVPEDTKPAKTEESVVAGEQAEESGVAADEFTFDSLYAEAVALAKESGDAALAEILEKQSRIGASKGRVGGPVQYHWDRVSRAGTDRYRVQFYAGQQARITVHGSEGDVDLYVYDEYGGLVAKDTSYSRTAHVSWYPRWTGYFTITVENCASRSVSYRLYTN